MNEGQTSGLVEKLSRTGQASLKFFNEISDEHWNVEIYSDGPAWKVHNLLAHLVEAEGSIPRLIQNILGGGKGVPQDFDLDQHNEREVAKMSRFRREELINEFSRRRQNTIDLVAALSEEQLNLSGRHPFLGEAEIGEMVRLMMLHNRSHERDIRKILKKLA